MFFAVVLVVILAIVGTAVIVGLNAEKKARQQRRPLTEKEKVQLARTAGAFRRD